MPDIRVDGRVINYNVRRSQRARRGRILVGVDGVEVVVPTGVALACVTQWVHARRRWILARYTEFEQRRERAQPYCNGSLTSGSMIMYRGSPVTLLIEPPAAGKRRAHLSLRQDRLHVWLPPQAERKTECSVAQALERWMREQLKGRAAALMAVYADKLCVNPTALRIKTQKRRWGSCGATGIINLNWRLAMAPDAVVAYVVVHELCHLLQRNHSRAFWSLVAWQCPDYRTHKRWLEEHDLILAESLSATSWS